MRIRALGVCAGVALLVGRTWAVDEVLGTRTDLPNQGYLQYKVNPSAGVNRFGEEVTGWMDIRHPLLDGTTTNVFQPYDRSNHFINENSILLKDSANVQASPDMLRDWDRSSKVYAQAGISTPRISSATAQLPLTWANFDRDARINFANSGTGRAAAASTLNIYYAKSFSGALANGLSIQPRQVNGTTVLNPYSYISDGSADSTHPHEAGHQLLNTTALWQESDPTTESSDTKNWMYETGANYSFQEIGRNNGRIESTVNVGTVSQMRQLYNNGGANNPGFVQVSVNHQDYGNRVDWDYVQDDYTLEKVGREGGVNGAADDHPGTTDSLYFAPGVTSVSAQANHDHTGLGTFQNTPDYAGAFRYADVFSIIGRYSDFDRFDANSDFSDQNGGLDYNVVFLGADSQFYAGTLDTIFDFGWTTNTTADNYLGRWVSPVDAVGMFIFAKNADGTFDGNTQIDAVIVSAVPEPVSGLLAAGAGALLLCRRRHSS